jgi:AcrR family transcriptional regulator
MKSKAIIPIRDRIFASALREFADHGFSGARLERIAARARTNKRMIVYYFKSKEKLYSAVRESAWEQIPEDLSIRPEDILTFWAEFAFRNPDWARVQAWEHFDLKNQKLTDMKTRRVYWKREIEKVDRWRASRSKCLPVSSAYLLLVLVAIENIPTAYPVLARMLVDKDLSEPRHRGEWLEICKVIGKFLVGPENAT